MLPVKEGCEAEADMPGARLCGGGRRLGALLCPGTSRSPLASVLPFDQLLH